MERPKTLTPDGLQRISDWLIDVALGETVLETLVAGFAERLRDEGMALWRLSVGTHLLNPTIEARTVRWQEGKPLESETFAVGSSLEPQFLSAPLAAAINQMGVPLRRRLEGPDAVLDFPILNDLKAEGATDYVALATHFSAYGRPDQPTGTALTWATRRPGGFDDLELAAIERLQPRLAVAVKAATVDLIARDVTAAYLGRDAARRVLAGDMERGQMETIRAALFFCDLRGFTSLSDRTDLGAVITLLNEYFEAIVTPIETYGGEVLKYLGDGLLAVFPLEGRSAQSVCAALIRAAAKVLAAADDVSTARRAAGAEGLDLDIALHLGDVMYGNIGAGNRLDFTIIGPAVNAASRIEGLCDGLGTRLLLTEPVVEACGEATPFPFVSLGCHALRGVAEPVALYTIDRG